MAGAVLPPDVLARMVVLHVVQNGEQSSSSAFSANDDDDKLQKLRNAIHKSQPPQDHDDDDSSGSYDWQQLPELPTATLDQLTLVQNNQDEESWHCRFQVRLDQYDLQLEFQPSPESLKQLQICSEAYETTEAWWGLALALRYKAPIVVESSSNDRNKYPKATSLDELQNQFPQLLTAQTLHSNAQRLTTNIETAFAETKHSKWYKALEIAHQKGDIQAAEKIQALIHQLESQDKNKEMKTARDDSISSYHNKRDERDDADWDSLHVDADTGAWQ